MFINELFIYVNYFKEQFLEETGVITDPKQEQYFSGFYNQS